MAKLNSGSKLVESFFSDSRSIQRTYNFMIDFPDSNNDSGNLKHRLSVLSESAGFSNFSPRTYLSNYHVKKVNVDQYAFKKEMQQIGVFPKTIPVLDHKGFELEIELEEDARGTIGFFIQWLQARILDEFGLYTDPNTARLGPVNINITDETSDLIATYSFMDCYFLKASKPEYNYRNNNTITYTITFGSDYYELVYSKGSVPAVNTKQNPINSGGKGHGSQGGGGGAGSILGGAGPMIQIQPLL